MSGTRYSPETTVNILALADAIHDAREAWANAIGTPLEARLKMALEQTLWNDKGGFAPMLRELAELRNSASSNPVKLAYVKRWRTIVRLPAQYADEIVEALRDHGVAQSPARGRKMTMGLPCDRDGYDLRMPKCPKCGSRGCPEITSFTGKCSADKPPTPAPLQDRGQP